MREVRLRGRCEHEEGATVASQPSIHRRKALQSKHYNDYAFNLSYFSHEEQKIYALSPLAAFSCSLRCFCSRLAAGLALRLSDRPPCKNSHEQMKTTAMLNAQKAQKIA